MKSFKDVICLIPGNTVLLPSLEPRFTIASNLNTFYTFVSSSWNINSIHDLSLTMSHISILNYGIILVVKCSDATIIKLAQSGLLQFWNVFHVILIWNLPERSHLVQKRIFIPNNHSRMEAAVVIDQSTQNFQITAGKIFKVLRALPSIQIGLWIIMEEFY